jgi:ribonuclease-3
MTNILKNRASNNALATLGRSKGLDEHVIINPAQWGIVSNKTMATTVEALIGAVFLDSRLDINSVRAVMVNLGIMDRTD